MAERDEVYVVNPQTLERAAVPRKHFDANLTGDGWVIDPDGPTAPETDTRTVRSAEKKIEKAAEARVEAAE